MGGVFKQDFSKIPKSTWLTTAELENYGLPGFWKLNRMTGVWIESKLQVLDNDGTYRFDFN